SDHLLHASRRLVFVKAPVRGADSACSPVSRDSLRRHVEYLADDLLEGRGTATRGYDLAAAYVAAQFRQYGMKHAGDQDTYFQSVPLIEATPVLDRKSTRLNSSHVKIAYAVFCLK